MYQCHRSIEPICCTDRYEADRPAPYTVDMEQMNQCQRGVSDESRSAPHGLRDRPCWRNNEAQRIATRHWSACQRGQIDAVKCRMEGPAVRSLGLVVGDGAPAESRDDDEEEAKDYKEGVAFHLPPQSQFFRDSVTFYFPRYFAVLIPSSFNYLLGLALSSTTTPPSPTSTECCPSFPSREELQLSQAPVLASVSPS